MGTSLVFSSPSPFHPPRAPIPVGRGGEGLLSTPLPVQSLIPTARLGAGATCSECRWFDGEEGWCGLHNSANWPDVPMCRLGELRLKGGQG